MSTSTLIRAFRTTFYTRTSITAPITSSTSIWKARTETRAFAQRFTGSAAVHSVPEQEAIDVQLIPPNEARIELTDRAAEARLPPPSFPLSFNPFPMANALNVLGTDHRSARAEPECGAVHRGRVGRVPWVPAQESAVRRLNCFISLSAPLASPLPLASSIPQLVFSISAEPVHTTILVDDPFPFRLGPPNEHET